MSGNTFLFDVFMACRARLARIVSRFSQSMASNFALYDVIGRSYVAGVRFKF